MLPDLMKSLHDSLIYDGLMYDGLLFNEAVYIFLLVI